jgi:hypothetical protein
VMPLEAIKALPVHELARGDCLLLLWTTRWANATGPARLAPDSANQTSDGLGGNPAQWKRFMKRRSGISK